MISSKGQGDKFQEVLRSINKVKSLDSSNDRDNFSFDESNQDNSPTPEEIEANKGMLFGDDTDMQSMAINFFAQTINNTINLDSNIYQRILSLADSSDSDVLDSVIDFLCRAVRSKTFVFDQALISFSQNLLLTLFQTAQSNELISSVVHALFLFSQRFPELKIFYSNCNIIQNCCDIIHTILNSGQLNIKLISDCFRFMNIIYCPENTDALSQFVVPLFQELISFIENSGTRSAVSLKKLAMNSLRFFIRECSDQVLAQVFNEQMARVLFTSLDLSDKDSIILALSLFIAISFHSPEFSLPLFPYVSSIIQTDLNFNAKQCNQIRLMILGILRNFAANDDQNILSFIASEPVLNYLQSSIKGSLPYNVLVQSFYVLAYISISSVEVFLRFFWENNRDVIPEMIGILDLNDLEAALNIFECVRNLLVYLQKTDQNSFEECIQILQNSEIETIIQDVLDLGLENNEQLTVLANQLCDIMQI